MFRRKEENMNDATSPVGGAPATPPGNSGGNAHAETVAPSTPSQSSINVGGSTTGGTAYVPGTSSAVRSAPVSEPSRPVAPAQQASSYRPTPIAEFNRGASRTAPDAMRTAAPTASASSFGAPDKNAAAKSNRRVLTVGNDILLKGEIATCDRLVIEGRVEAKLSEVHTVEIAEVGSFKGTAEVEDAEISGVFEGDLIVRNRLVIYASGEVRGNISYGEIEIERGGRLTGQIKTANAGAAGVKGKAYETDKRKETAAA